MINVHNPHWTLPFSGRRFAIVWFTRSDTFTTYADEPCKLFLSSIDFPCWESYKDLPSLTLPALLALDQC